MGRLNLTTLLAMSLTPLMACAPKTADTDSGDGPIEIVGGAEDADRDSILDEHEGTDDADRDGTPNYLDLDSDGDGISDADEAGDNDPNSYPDDTDGDGTPDFLDEDSDDNGLSDSIEAIDPSSPADTDRDGEPDHLDDDNDGDGILDTWELAPTPASPPDTDEDGDADHIDLDADGDSLCDRWERGVPSGEPPVDTDGDGVEDYRDLDSDNDTLSDADEAGVSSDCSEPTDSDGDGSYDSADSDADGDGLSDADEVYIYSTDPYDRDSDGDGYTDGAEVTGGSNPLDSGSDLGDAWVVISDWAETEHTLAVDLSIEYVDLAFVLDTTCSNAGLLTGAALGFEGLAASLASQIDSPMYSVATFDDYSYSGMGGIGDKPFTLTQQITDDEGLVESTLMGLGIHSGMDTHESAMEALYQTATGAGYDQGCDGWYGSSDDILPFIADASDPFGGTGGASGDPTGAGDIGGVGFRPYALPILLYATDYYIRDPDSSNGTLAATPGGCPIDAGSDDVARAVADLGAYLIGFDIGPGAPDSPTGPYAQMEALAWATGSVADMDDDGDADDVLVISAYQGVSDFAVMFREEILIAVEKLLASVVWDSVTIEVVGDSAGLVTGVSPEAHTNVETYTVGSIDFTLSLDAAAAPAADDDQHFILSFYVLGDDSVLLNTYDIVLTVSGAP